jgi:hypothetical protein
MDESRLQARRLAALAHPLRLQILAAAESQTVSPSQLAVELGQPLGVVAYHFRVLHTVGLIELVATEQRRGSIQSFYRSIGHGWADVAGTLRALVSVDLER